MDKCWEIKVRFESGKNLITFANDADQAAERVREEIRDHKAVNISLDLVDVETLAAPSEERIS